ncbi:hypothetical protein EW026_g7284 [Hermanssonia centrifuga]|uniref:Uncharacterized protein n=1 Tax=Hermanssonia centrifuga TaxID=98765 RepID=A0A4S4K8J4_9APHY|nr:hypothetical protein EW026_g7284 [Hermanssonia centrifuga]
MPLLLNVLQNANTPEYRKLRLKAMELVAIAVGRDVFRPDSAPFIEQLMRIQNSPIDPGDTLLTHYLIATWAKVCQALGPEFEPYLPVVMPPLLLAASAKADLSVFDEADPSITRDGWETISMDGQQIGIKTSSIEEKCQAFETLVIYCSTLGPRFAPYLPQSLELVLPSLRFYFHDGAGTYVTIMWKEQWHSYAADGLRFILASSGGPTALPQDIQVGIIEATKRQLQALADRRKARAVRPASEVADDKEDLMLIEEMEEFALEDMAKMLSTFDPNHPLLIAISSVRDLGLHLEQWESGDEGDPLDG